jgi:hypothetical protein
MDVQPDFRDLLALFNKNNVDYVIVGGYALAFHGAPRYTGDLDILVKADRENAARILAALDAYGFGSLAISIDDLSEPRKVIQLGFPPVRIDILTSITGVSWEDVHRDRVAASFGDVPVHFIGRRQFVLNKRAVGRKRDLADLEALAEE